MAFSARVVSYPPSFPAGNACLSFPACAVLVAAAVAAAAGHGPVEPARGAELQRFSSAEVHMATSFTLVAYAADEPTATSAFAAAFARIAALDELLNDYDPDSALSRLSAASPTPEPIPVAADLLAVLERSLHFARLTDGAFDPTIGPLTRLWRQARVKGRLAPPDALSRAKSAVGYRHLQVDAAAATVSLGASGMRLDLGGIAQGFAADEALRVLAARGLVRALVDASGDVACGLPPPGRDGWRVRIAGSGGPEDGLLSLAGRAVSTSGDAFQSVEIDGVRYSHIVDPQSGLGITRRSSATVIAPDCITADALATALCVLPPDRGLELIAALEEVEARIVSRALPAPGQASGEAGEGDLVVRESPGFTRLMVAP